MKWRHRSIPSGKHKTIFLIELMNAHQGKVKKCRLIVKPIIQVKKHVKIFALLMNNVLPLIMLPLRWLLLVAYMISMNQDICTILMMMKGSTAMNHIVTTFHIFIKVYCYGACKIAICVNVPFFHFGLKWKKKTGKCFGQTPENQSIHKFLELFCV